MKKLFIVFTALILCSCSFDNKTGIWKDASSISVDNKPSKSIKENLSNKKYEDIFIKRKIFNEEIEVISLSNFPIDKSIKIQNWLEQFGIPTNNISNFFYTNNKVLISKKIKLNKFTSKKNKLNENIIFNENKLITHNSKGTISIFSLDLNKKIFQYNFYKKNFRNIEKKINFLVNKNILYAADNLGYLYAINLDNNSLVWAKNFGIPFRSNIKFAKNQIFLSNQDNVFYSINSKTGDKVWQYATGLTFLKSDFKNNIALDLVNNNLFFLNTSGQLYSINFFDQKINWVLNFKNPSLSGDLSGDTELFLSHPLVFKDNNLIVSTEQSILNYNPQTGSPNWKFYAEPIFKPIITLNHTYVILKQNLLLCIDNSNGEVIWSRSISKNIMKKKTKSKNKKIADFKMVNSKLNIYYKNGNLLSFNPFNGDLNSVNKISRSGINSEIFFINGNMLFVNKKNRFLQFN